MHERTVILYTFSKKFAMTGWRLGCAVAPVEIAKVLSTLNTNDESCTTHYVQWAGVEALRGAQDPVRQMLEVLCERRDTACEIVNSIPGMNVAVPHSTFYLFPDVTEAMDRMGYTAVGDFAAVALHQTGVSFCTREHFGRRRTGEERRVHPTRLLGHRGRRNPRGPRPSERVDQGRMSRIVVTGRVPDAAIDKLRLEHGVDAWPGRSRSAPRSSCAAWPAPTPS